MTLLLPLLLIGLAVASLAHRPGRPGPDRETIDRDALWARTVPSARQEPGEYVRRML